MYNKKRIKNLEDKVFKEYTEINVNGETLRTKTNEILELLSEIIQAGREKREPNHRLIEQGILEADREQHSLLGLIIEIEKARQKHKGVL